MMPLTEQNVPCWEVTCDRCGDGDNEEYGGSFHYHTQAEARQSLAGMDWVELPDGRWLCFSCFEEERAEHPCSHGGRCTGACGDDCWPSDAALQGGQP